MKVKFKIIPTSKFHVEKNEYNNKPNKLLTFKTLTIFDNKEKPKISFISSGNEKQYKYIGRHFGNILQ